MTALWKGGRCALLALAGCKADRAVTPASHRSPPSVRVLSPTDSGYSASADSLVDLVLQWADSGGVVHAAAVRVRALAGVNAPGGDTVNLLDHWRVERRDSTGLVARETADYLLHGGPNRLEVTVPDTAGNARVDTISFTLPYAALIKTIASGSTGFPPAIGIAVCSDDRKVYMPIGDSIVVVDADSLRLVNIIGPDLRYSASQIWNLLCVPGDPVLYVAADNGLLRFDRATGQWHPNVGTFVGYAVTQSRADPDLLYLAWDGGVVGMARRSLDTTVGYLLTPIGTYSRNSINDVAVLAGDTKLFAASYGTGVWTVDPHRNVLLDSISLGDTSVYGVAQNLAVSPDDRALYAPTTYGYPRGVHKIDTSTDRDVGAVSLNPFSAIRLALSPDGNRIFVTTQDNGSLQSSNALIDVPSWQVIQLLSRPRPVGQTRYDQGVAFHPNGKYIFVAHNRDLDVYLHRP
jgi:DNA-binding beta-propeller fold protein YncE